VFPLGLSPKQAKADPEFNSVFKDKEIFNSLWADFSHAEAQSQFSRPGYESQHCH
jgi:hypothetical protein